MREDVSELLKEIQNPSTRTDKLFKRVGTISIVISFVIWPMIAVPLELLNIAHDQIFIISSILLFWTFGMCPLGLIFGNVIERYFFVKR